MASPVLGRRGTCQTDPSKGARPEELPPSLPSVFSFCALSLSPFLRLFRAPSCPPPSFAPARALPFFPSLPTPSLSGAGVSPRRTEAPGRVRAARGGKSRPGLPMTLHSAGRPPFARGRPRAGGARSDCPSLRARARGVRWEGPLRAGCRGSLGPGSRRAAVSRLGTSWFGQAGRASFQGGGGRRSPGWLRP